MMLNPLLSTSEFMTKTIFFYCTDFHVPASLWYKVKPIIQYVITLLFFYGIIIGLLILIVCIIVECDWQMLRNRE